MKAILFTLLLPLFVAASPVKHKEKDKCANQVLDMVLLVGSDFRAQGKKATWADIDKEVARRLKIQRNKAF